MLIVIYSPDYLIPLLVALPQEVEIRPLPETITRFCTSDIFCVSRWGGFKKPPFKMNRRVLHRLANGCMWTWLTLILPVFMFAQTWTSAIICQLRMRRGREPRFTPIEVPNDELP